MLEIFKADPFDPRLKAHKIHKLSAAYGRTVWSAYIESDLRVIFLIDDSGAVTLNVGSHDLYR